jgi:hypothetical protein
MTIEQRLEQLEKRNRGLTVALTMMAVTICAVVTMAATGLKNANFDEVTARRVYVENNAGNVVVALAALPEGSGGDGLVRVLSGKRKNMVVLTSTVDGAGTVTTYQPNGKGRTLQPGP